MIKLARQSAFKILAVFFVLSAALAVFFSVSQAAGIQTAPYASSGSNGNLNHLTGANPLTTAVGSNPVATNPDDNLATVQAPAKVINNLQALRDQNISFMANDQGGQLEYINGDTKPIPLSKKVAAPQVAAVQFLKDYGPRFGLTAADTKVGKPTIKTSTGLGHTYSHYYYPRFYKGLEVYGSSFLIHTNELGEVMSATGNVGEVNINTTPSFSATSAQTKAKNLAKAKYGMTAPQAGKATLIIFNPKYLNGYDQTNKDYLAYTIDVSNGNDHANDQRLIIDAKTGLPLIVIPLTKKIIDCEVRNCHGTENNCIGNSDLSKPNSGRFEGDSRVTSDDVNQSYDQVHISYDWFARKHSLDGANNKGGITKPGLPNQNQTPIYASRETDSDTKGYYFENQGITISDQIDGSPRDIRFVLYHEYTHAVVQFQGPTSLDYLGESAVINEAYAEIYAIFINQSVTGDPAAWATNYRDFRSPDSSEPLTHYSVNYICNDEDFIYDNLYVIGRLAFLLSEGGVLEDCNIEKVGGNIVEALLYSTLDNYLPNDADFNGLYAAVNSACQANYDQDTCDKVKYAMQVAQLDEKGICKDPNEIYKGPRHCDDNGRKLQTEKPDSYYCNKYGYNCDSTSVMSEVTGKYITINCGTCANSSDECYNNKCRGCVADTYRELCDRYGYECGYRTLIDNCHQTRRVNCDLEQLSKHTTGCPKGKTCSDSGKCVQPKAIKGNGGQNDVNGNPATDGGYYRHITVGTDSGSEVTLFKDNFNGGVYLDDSKNQTSYQKYCYNNNGGKCLALGGLYQWHTAMGLPAECDTKDCSDQIKSPHQGICPEGWHVPSDSELSMLEQALKTPGNSCDSARLGLDCYTAGAEMRLGGENDFTAKFNGTTDAVYLSTTPSDATKIYARTLVAKEGPPVDKNQDSTLSGETGGVLRLASDKSGKFALRCFADCDDTGGARKLAEWGPWKPIGGCGEIKPGVQVQYRDCQRDVCGGNDCAGATRQEIPCNEDKSCGDLVKYDGGPLNKYGGTYISANRPGGYYATVQIGDQCWLANNLNAGSMIATGKDANPGGTIEKYCVNNDVKWCGANGGLYQWEETINKYFGDDWKNWNTDSGRTYPMNDDAWTKGICPDGWKVPAPSDWEKLNKSEAAKNQGLLSKEFCRTHGGSGCGRIGFNVSPFGEDEFIRYWSSLGEVQIMGFDKPHPENEFFAIANIYNNINWGGGLSEKPDNAWYLYFPKYDHPKYKSGLPVRCIKEDCRRTNGGWSDWQKVGDCGQYEAYMQKYSRTCNNPEPKCGGKNCEGSTTKAERCKEVDNCGIVKYEGGPYAQDGQTRDQGGYYRTVSFKGTNARGETINQCWLRDNLNVGKLIPADGDQKNDSVIEKYSRYYEIANGAKNLYGEALTIAEKYGGLYQWTEALGLPSYCSSAAISSSKCQVKPVQQGICPTGWHIPTDEEWHIMEVYFSSYGENDYEDDESHDPTLAYKCIANRMSAKSSGSSDDKWAIKNCSDVGYKLRNMGMNGFDALTQTYFRTEDGTFYSRNDDLRGCCAGKNNDRDYTNSWKDPIPATDEFTAFWTTKAANDKTVIVRFLITDYNAGFYRQARAKREGLSVRCIKDACVDTSGLTGLNNPHGLVGTLITNGPMRQRITAIQQTRTALENYHKDIKSYPKTLTAGKPLKSPNGRKTYLKAVPKDIKYQPISSALLSSDSSTGSSLGNSAGVGAAAGNSPCVGVDCLTGGGNGLFSFDSRPADCGQTKNTCVPGSNKIIVGSNYCEYDERTNTTTCHWSCPGANNREIRCVKTETVPNNNCCNYNPASTKNLGACCKVGLPFNFITDYDGHGQATYSWLCCSNPIINNSEGNYDRTGDCLKAGGTINAKCSGQESIPPGIVSDDYTLTYDVPGEPCDGSTGPYIATSHSFGLVLGGSNTPPPATNVYVPPTAANTPPISTAVPLSEAEQLVALKSLVSQTASAKLYTSEQLLFINSPLDYLHNHGFTEAQRLLSSAGSVAR